jgi:hypothetical protein
VAGGARRPVLFAELRELLLIAEHPLSGTNWPPPDTSVRYVGPLGVFDPLADHSDIGEGLAFEVVSDRGALPVGGFWWTTLGALLTDEPNWQVALGPELLLLYKLAVPTFVGVVADIPVYFRGDDGGTMRWLRTTFRGTLDGVEQFQHKVDFGKPGDDPTTTDVQQLALATDFAAKWTAATATLMARLPADVTYTELGVVEMTATESTAADGSGGNTSESNTTQWFMWPVGGQPHGLSPGIALPYEVALAITLQTDHRGPSGRGRTYLPPLNVNAMVAGGKFGPGIATECGAQLGDFFAAVKADHDLVPVVVSSRRLILNEITSVNVGVIPDSQRRRRRSQDEARIVAWTG